MQHCLNRVINFREVLGREKDPVASSGRQAFSFFSHARRKTFSIFISWHRSSRMEVKKRIYLHFIDPLFAIHIRHVTMKLFRCLPWASGSSLKNTHVTRFNWKILFTQINPGAETHVINDEKRKTFLFVILANFCVLDVKNLRNDLWDRLQLIIKVRQSFLSLGNACEKMQPFFI